MTKETGTLREIGARPGDLVQCAVTGRISEIGDPSETGFSYVDTYGNSLGTDTIFGMVARETLPDTPKTWGEMTDAEKGALLLARHEGKEIEHSHNRGAVWKCRANNLWHDNHCYRIKPEPKRETVTLYALSVDGDIEINPWHPQWPYCIAMDTLEGKPICGTFTNENGDTIHVELNGGDQ